MHEIINIPGHRSLQATWDRTKVLEQAVRFSVSRVYATDSSPEETGFRAFLADAWESNGMHCVAEGTPEAAAQHFDAISDTLNFLRISGVNPEAMSLEDLNQSFEHFRSARESLNLFRKTLAT